MLCNKSIPIVIVILITLIIPPKERERQCFLLKGVRESDVGVSRGCFSNCTQTDEERKGELGREPLL